LSFQNILKIFIVDLSGMFMKGRYKKLRKNPAALISAFLVLISAFLFQLFNINIFGEITKGKHYTMMTYITGLFSSKVVFNDSTKVMDFILAIVFVIIFLLYLFNGLGVIYNRYSRYASYLTVVYAVIGLFLYNMLTSGNVSFFGLEFAGVSLGLGIYFIPLVGILYLFLARTINSKIQI